MITVTQESGKHTQAQNKFNSNVINNVVVATYLLSRNMKFLLEVLFLIYISDRFFFMYKKFTFCTAKV